MNKSTILLFIVVLIGILTIQIESTKSDKIAKLLKLGEVIKSNTEAFSII